MTTPSKVLLSQQTDKDSMLSDPPLSPWEPETSGEPRAVVVQAKIIEKWKRKFTFGLRSEKAEATALSSDEIHSA